MKITYLILAHRYPEQLYRLVDRLNCQGVNFLIHIDKKVEEDTFNKIVDKFKPLQNVFFIQRYKCFWGGFGIAQATYQGLIEVVEREISFDYICLMSGQDYPIKSNEFIKDFLEKNNGKSFINTVPFPNPIWEWHNGGYDRIHNWYFIKSNNQYGFPHKLFKIWPTVTKFFSQTLGKIIPKRHFPSKYMPYGGAQFWILHKDHVNYVLNDIKENPEFFKFFKYVLISDEILFQTIMGNHPEKKHEVVNDSLHYLEWGRKGLTLTKEDKEKIVQTYHLFARKFDTNVDAEILDWIDLNILKC